MQRQARACAPGRSSFERLLRPRSLAIVGASPEPFSLGGNVLDNVERFGFVGALHLVSRTRSEIKGRPCVATIDDLPDGVDAVVLVIPVPAVRDAIAACARRGVGGAVVFASGFGEMGGEGARLQAEMTALAREAGIALLGPNCLGAVNFVDGVPLTFEPVQPLKPSGPGVCAIAQSGAMAGNIRMALASRGVPVAYTFSTGNEAVLAAEDVIAGLLDDDSVRLFAVFVEQIRQPKRFLELAAAALARRKPIVLMHPGRSARSREAAKSHTGALAGDYAVMKTFVEREGVVLVESLDELFDTSALLARYPTPPAGGAAIMSNSGALRGFSLDFCDGIDLPLPVLTETTVAALQAVLPDFATIDNPLDITAQGMQKPSLFGDSVAALLADSGVGAVLVAAMGGSPAQQMKKWESLAPVMRAAEKPVALAFLGDGAPLSPEFMTDVKASGVPFFRSPERAMRAFAHMLRYGRALATGSARAPLGGAAALELTPGPMAEYRVKAIFRDTGIAVPQGELARDLDEALRIAAAIGYPLVLKAQAAALMHKSDVGGVAVGIRDDAALRAAWDKMTVAVAQARPDLTLDGILVEAMAAPGGLELIVGARRDPVWGEVLMVGLGGIWAEALGDVRLMPADADASHIAAELDRLKAARLLHGYRGAPPRDIAALVEALMQIGALIRATPSLGEIDVNPLLVYPQGQSQGVVALDALLVADPSPQDA
ncbi:MAG: CoA-binding protein [Rhodopseudomonas sp.]|nr:CoA-binding protein [Rhodopseudomonas sp.]